MREIAETTRGLAVLLRLNQDGLLMLFVLIAALSAGGFLGGATLSPPEGYK